jgi:hypothetical protein
MDSTRVQLELEIRNVIDIKSNRIRSLSAGNPRPLVHTLKQFHDDDVGSREYDAQAHELPNEIEGELDSTLF